MKRSHLWKCISCLKCDGVGYGELVLPVSLFMVDVCTPYTRESLKLASCVVVYRHNPGFYIDGNYILFLYCYSFLVSGLDILIIYILT